MLNIDVMREDAMKELEPRLLPVRKFIAHVKDTIETGVDMLDTATLADWMFIVPTMYGELRCIEADCLLVAELFESRIDKVKADAMVDKGLEKVTEVRARAAQAANDLQIQQQVAKFMARTVGALWNQLEMYIFSIRSLFDSKVNVRVKNDV